MDRERKHSSGKGRSQSGRCAKRPEAVGGWGRSGQMGFLLLWNESLGIRPKIVALFGFQTIEIDSSKQVK
jgi:hypothetical protein